MNKETAKSIGRALLTLIGTVLIGKNVLGHAIDENLLQELGGVAFAFGGIIWGIFDHSATIEKIQSVLHSGLVVIAGVGISWGLISAQTAMAIIGLATAAIPVILSYTSKVKIKQADAGKIVPDTTTGKMVQVVK